MILLLLISIVIPMIRSESQILTLQNKKEQYYFNLGSNKDNASFTINSIEPANNFTKAFQIPNITFFKPIQLINKISINQSFCPINVWGSNKYPISLALSPTNIRVIFFDVSEQNPKISNEDRIIYFDSTLYPGIKCNHLIQNPQNQNSIFIDCRTQTQFINVTIDLTIGPNGDFENIELNYETYIFDDDEFMQYWSSCIKKEINFISYLGRSETIYTCRIVNHDLLFKDSGNDSIVAISYKSSKELGVLKISLTKLGSSNFSECSKSLATDRSFHLEDITYREHNIKQTYLGKLLWDFALLIRHRSGLCKCTIATTKLKCSFFELQESNYTRLRQMKSLNNTVYFYLSSSFFVFRVSIQDYQKTIDDRIDGYFSIQQSNYKAVNVKTFLNFILVQLSPINDYDESFTMNCILDVQPPSLNVQIYKLFEQETGYIFKNPSLILKKMSNVPLLAIQNLYKYGNYLFQWDSGSQELGLHSLSLKQGLITYDYDNISMGTFLLWKVNSTMEYLLEDTIQSKGFDFKVAVVPFNDTKISNLMSNSYELEEFYDQEFSFALDKDLIGPSKQYIEVQWEQYQVESEIEFIKFLQINDFPQEIDTVYQVSLEISYLGKPTLKILGSYLDENKENYSIQYWVCNYTINNTNGMGVFETPQKIDTLDSFISLPLIDFVQLNYFFGVFGSLKTLEIYLCQNQFSTSINISCMEFVGDLLQEPQGLTYMSLLLIKSNNDILITIPSDGKSVKWFIYDAYTRPSSGKIETRLLGQLNSTTIEDLLDDNVKIIDFHFDLKVFRTSALLLSTGNVIILSNQMIENDIEFQITNRIVTNDCEPSPDAQSRIFIIPNNGLNLLILICNNLFESRIFEYLLNNLYQAVFMREYPLYSYELMQNSAKYGGKSVAQMFTSGHMVYIPARNTESNMIVYLVIDPMQQSPNLLVQTFDMEQANPKINLAKKIDGLSVLNTEAESFNFTLAFMRSSERTGLYYVNYQPTYLGRNSANANVSSITKMMMIYQESNQNIIFKPFELQFNFQDSQIKLTSQSLVIQQPDDNTPYSDHFGFTVDVQSLGIEGPVQAYSLDFEGIVIKKQDIAELTKQLMEHYEASQLGQPLDLTHLDDPDYRSFWLSNQDERNLVFVVTATHFVAIEKEYKCDGLEQCHWRKFKIDPLERVIVMDPIPIMCSISFSGINSLLLLCSNEEQDKKQLHQSEIFFIYDRKLSTLNYTYNNLTNLLGGVQINQIQPLNISGQIYQFLKFNYVNALDQEEIQVGIIANVIYSYNQLTKNTLDIIKVIQSSNINSTALGPMFFDSYVDNQTQLIYLIIAKPEYLMIRVYSDGLFNHPMECYHNQEQLNASIYESSTTHEINFIRILSVIDGNLTILLGTQYNYYMIEATQGCKLNRLQYYRKYFLCKNALYEVPTIVDQSLNQLIVTCIGRATNSNPFLNLEIYSKDSNLVYIQFFSKEQSQSIVWPSRVIEVVNSKQSATFIVSSAQVKGTPYILVENYTHFFQAYRIRNNFSFSGIMNKSTAKNGSSLKGTLTILNDYASVQATIIIQPRTINDHYKLWLIVIISVVVGLFTLLSAFILYTLFGRRNFKFRIASTVSAGIMENELSTKKKRKKTRSEEFMVEDRLSSRDFGVKKKSYKFSTYRSQDSANSNFEESKIFRQNQQNGQVSSESD